MLTPEYLKNAPDNVVKLVEEMELKTIKDISRRIAKNMELTATADYQIEMLYRMGYSIKDIEANIAKEMGIASEELEKILLDASRESYKNDQRIYRDGGKYLPTLSDNKPLQSFIKATAKQTKDTFKNFTKTIGIVTSHGPVKLTDFYRDTLNSAVLQVGAGVIDHNTAIKNAVITLGNSGIRVIEYKSGTTRQIESATRTAVLTGLRQITGHMSIANADMMDQDLMEITAHWGARPEHAEWQGKIVSRSGNPNYLSLDDIGYGEVTGFQGANCRHDWFPFFEGVSKRNYTDDELRNFDPPDIEYDGKTYTYYEATQRQRQIERQIRNSKRKIAGYEGAGLEDELIAEKVRLRRLNNEYNNFSNAAGIRPKRERMYTYKESNKTKIVPKKVTTPNVKGLTKPIRPKASDFGDDYEGLTKARLKYREERDKYRQEIDKVIKANLEKPRQYKTVDDVEKWAKERGYIVDTESLKHMDARAFDDYIKITDELMEKYPMVKARYEKHYDLKYHLRYVSRENGGHFLADASSGFDFGDSFTNYELVQKMMLESMTSGAELMSDGTKTAGDMIMGDGTINNLYRHEFGHLLKNAISDRFYRKDNFKDLDVHTSVAFDRDIIKTLYGKEGMSSYATTNSSELFAEAFAEYESGSNTPFAKAFGELLKRWL
jgi:hypothetical protein